MADFCSFWFGGELTPYEVLAMKSFVDHGHSYTLFTYDSVSVPDRVAIGDAAEILPRDRLFLYRSGPGRGSVAGFTNLFRYHLLYTRGGWWVDADVVCLSSEVPQPEIFLGWEGEGLIGSAILRFPAGHSFMATLRDAAESAGADISWGQTGPQLITRLALSDPIVIHAASENTAYPNHWRDALFVLDPAKSEHIREKVGRTALLHLWNEMFRRAGIDKQLAPPPESYLAELFDRHGIVAPGPTASKLTVDGCAIPIEISPQQV